jgi:hypothetical protein
MSNMTMKSEEMKETSSRADSGSGSLKTVGRCSFTIVERRTLWLTPNGAATVEPQAAPLLVG